MACLLTVCENAQLNMSCYDGKLTFWFGALLLILVLVYAHLAAKVEVCKSK